MRAHKIESTFQVGDKVSVYDTLTRTKMYGKIISGEYSGSMLWCQVTFEDDITMWLDSEQLDKEMN